MKAGYLKDQATSLEFPAPFPKLQRGEGGGGGGRAFDCREKNGVRHGLNNQSYPQDEASIKPPIIWGSESSQVCEHMEVVREWYAQKRHGRPMSLLTYLASAHLPSAV